MLRQKTQLRKDFLVLVSRIHSIYFSRLNGTEKAPIPTTGLVIWSRDRNRIKRFKAPSGRACNQNLKEMDEMDCLRTQKSMRGSHPSA